MANELPRSKRIEFDSSLEKNINQSSLDCLNKYISSMKLKELSPKTIYNYEKDIIQFLSYIHKYKGNKQISNINIENNSQVIDSNDIEDFIIYCQNEGNNAERIKRRCSVISAFYKFLKKRKVYIGDNPVDEIERPKKSRAVVLQTYLTLEQVKTIREWLKEKGNLQLELFFEIGLSTMGRVNALSNLVFSSCNLNEMMFEDVLEKEGKVVSLFFNEKVKKLIIDWKKYRYENKIENDYIFISKKADGNWDKVTVSTLQTWIGKIGIGAIGVKLHAHDLRHSGATLLKNAGMSLEDVSSLLNHESTDVTKKFYIKADDSKLAQVYRRYSV